MIYERVDHPEQYYDGTERRIYVFLLTPAFLILMLIFYFVTKEEINSSHEAPSEKRQKLDYYKAVYALFTGIAFVIAIVVGSLGT